jgi:hypothetical protein
MPPLVPLSSEFHRVAVLFGGGREHMPVIFISPAVLDAIDAGAAHGDPGLVYYRKELDKKLKAIKTKTHHQKFSQFFEQYSECLTYVLLVKRGLQLERINENPNKSPDFRTVASRPLFFEVKTLDFAAAPHAHDRHGKSSATRVIEKKSSPGIRTEINAIRPHGNATTPFEAIREVIRRIERNYKKDQFAFGPTFLVLPMTRTAIAADACSLASWYTQYRQKNTGHLWAIAANRVSEHFWEEGRIIGQLPDTGILRRRPEIAGIIFISTEWNLIKDTNALDTAFHLHGFWNREWPAAAKLLDTAPIRSKKVLVELCVAYNDTNDTQRAKLARLCSSP